MKKLGKMLSGAAIALALGYGATQAFASPAEQQGDYCRTSQERAECAINCQAQGLVGYCYQDVGCVCEIM